MITPPQTFDYTASPEERIKGVRKLITNLKLSGNRPILLGPWRSELGFEALYWLPFLRWMSTQIKGFDQRACVVTRGGLAPLYANIATRGFDLYALKSVDEVRRENLFDYRRLQMQKQLEITEWDSDVLEEAAKKLGVGSVFDVVHPAWMYWALSPFWDEHVGMRYLSQCTAYDTLGKPPKPDGLPENYVAVKFYGRATFPYPEHDVSQFIQRLCGTIATQVPIVVMVSGGNYDDHVDVALSGPNVVQLKAGNPEENLWNQAAVMAHAKAVIGTYGGAMQLALRMGVPTVSFWKEFGGTARAHLALSQWIGSQSGVPFVTSAISDLGLIHQCLVPPIVHFQPGVQHGASVGSVPATH